MEKYNELKIIIYYYYLPLTDKAHEKYSYIKCINYLE